MTNKSQCAKYFFHLPESHRTQQRSPKRGMRQQFSPTTSIEPTTRLVELSTKLLFHHVAQYLLKHTLQKSGSFVLDFIIIAQPTQGAQS